MVNPIPQPIRKLLPTLHQENWVQRTRLPNDNLHHQYLSLGTQPRHNQNHFTHALHKDKAL